MALQRRLASSPEAILRSIQRRCERLENRLKEERLLLQGRTLRGTPPTDARLAEGIDIPDPADLEDADDLPQEELDALEDRVMDSATAAQTLVELEVEIDRLKELERIALALRRSGEDRKWQEFQAILDLPEMFRENETRRKLIVFTESRDTLNYLLDRIRTRVGRAETVVAIHGGVTREERRNIVHAFMNDPTVEILVANDAAWEGVNLQKAHLMVNYDLPWNPNRLEQRFGRIHRIGQNEVCRLWNLVAENTREGEVYLRLLRKLETERESLGGKVFDVLGELFSDRPLRELLVEAIRYGDQPEVKARLHKEVEGAADRSHLEELLARRSLVHDTLPANAVVAIREARLLAYALATLAPAHLSEVRQRRLALLDKVAQEVKARLQKEINYWDARAVVLEEQERAGKETCLSAQNARTRADLLSERLRNRLAETDLQRHIMPAPPKVVGGILVVPVRMTAEVATPVPDPYAAALGLTRDQVEKMAMDAVFVAEKALGRTPRDVSGQRGIGYDIESRNSTGDPWFIEVKGRAKGADQITLTRTEMLCAPNKPGRFRLAIVVVDAQGSRAPAYVRGYDFGQPGFEQTSATFPLSGLIRAGGAPS